MWRDGSEGFEYCTKTGGGERETLDGNYFAGVRIELRGGKYWMDGLMMVIDSTWYPLVVSLWTARSWLMVGCTEYSVLCTACDGSRKLGEEKRKENLRPCRGIMYGVETEQGDPWSSWLAC